MGAFVPNGYSRDIMASGGGRIVGNTGSLTTTARLFFEQAGVPSSPLIQNPSSSLGGPPTPSTNSSPQTVTEYTFGATALRAPGAAWVDSFVVGVDGYRLANVQTNYTPVPSIVDSALRAAQGGADRATLRASRVFHFNADDPTRGSITLSAEHATLRASTMMSSAFVSGSGNRGPGSSGGPGGSGQDSREGLLTPLVTWQNSTGVTAQANAAINNTLFFTSGVRLEEDSRLAPGDRLATLPMFGVAGVNDVGPFTMKLRAAYGRGIRPPSTTQRWQLWQPQAAAQAALGPEVQSGTEVGLDVMLRQTLTVQLTRFDQRASGLIQQVPFASDSALTGRRMQYVAQNVGEISNDGWELGATSTLSRVTMNASFAAVDSRVRNSRRDTSATSRPATGCCKSRRSRRASARHGPATHGRRRWVERARSTGSTTTKWRSRRRGCPERNRCTRWSDRSSGISGGSTRAACTCARTCRTTFGATSPSSCPGTIS